MEEQTVSIFSVSDGRDGGGATMRSSFQIGSKNPMTYYNFTVTIFDFLESFNENFEVFQYILKIDLEFRQ